MARHSERGPFSLEKLSIAIQGDRYSGLIGVNGAAAHLVSPGDIVIVAAFELVDNETIAERVASGWSPRAVFVTADNQLREVRGEEAWRRAERLVGERPVTETLDPATTGRSGSPHSHDQ